MSNVLSPTSPAPLPAWAIRESLLRRIGALALLPLLIPLSGCSFGAAAALAEHSKDVSNDPKRWVGFHRGEVYALAQNAWLTEWPSITPFGKDSPSAEEYARQPGQYQQIDAIAPAGMRLRIDKLVWHEGIEIQRIELWAKRMYGPKEGELVDITALCTGPWPEGPLSPNPRYLRRVDPPP